MHSSSLGARPVDFCAGHKLSAQCALHKHHNMNNRGIRQEFGKTTQKNRFYYSENRFSDPQKPENQLGTVVMEGVWRYIGDGGCVGGGTVVMEGGWRYSGDGGWVEVQW